MNENPQYRFLHFPVPTVALGGTRRPIFGSRNVKEISKGLIPVPGTDGGTAIYTMPCRRLP
jgi:hypothetical protein